MAYHGYRYRQQYAKKCGVAAVIEIRLAAAVAHLENGWLRLERI
jgi:hypothetical protein